MSTELSHKEEIIQNLLIANCHLGGKKVTKQMSKYVYAQKLNGVQIFDVEKHLNLSDFFLLKNNCF